MTKYQIRKRAYSQPGTIGSSSYNTISVFIMRWRGGSNVEYVDNIRSTWGPVTTDWCLANSEAETGWIGFEALHELLDLYRLQSHLPLLLRDV